ncbi:FtsX-like permease family protein [Pontibacter sp. G13]|uniref:ABC transporter permease n=1 Tax=Pontibacter sp. G13 TaxID=3074898 RepID=UPI002889F1F3|nr:FtsX-like permease family protein [Pontibacter sp. G13]WNJ18202.1 FtsX-like permease family protein [Pontibacter sp. G13]
MNFEYYFAKRITFNPERKASSLVIRLGIVSIALAVATMEIALSFVQGFQNEISNKVVGFGSHLQVVTYFREVDTEVMPIDRYEPTLDSVRKLPYVASVSPYVEKSAALKSKTGWDGTMLRGVDSTFDWRFFATVLVDGALPEYGATEELYHQEILISKKQSKVLNLSVDDKAVLLFFPEPYRRRPVRVAGIYETGMEEFDNNVVICDMRLLQQIWDWNDNEVTGFSINLHDLQDLDQAHEEVNGIIPYSMGAESITYLFRGIFDWLSLLHQNVWVILILMMVVSIINMTSVTLILIIERANTVGILKAQGMSSSRIQRMFLWYALFLILIGIVLGNVIGLGLLASQDWLHWLRVSQEDYFIEVVPVAWVWSRFFIVNLMVALICTTAMVIPTWVINRITPLRAIRFQ